MAAACSPRKRELRGEGGGMKSRATSLRLPESLAVDIGVIARAEGIPISEFIREALENHVSLRRSEPGFKERLKERMAEDQEVFKRLAGD